MLAIEESRKLSLANLPSLTLFTGADQLPLSRKGSLSLKNYLEISIFVLFGMDLSLGCQSFYSQVFLS